MNEDLALSLSPFISDSEEIQVPKRTARSVQTNLTVSSCISIKKTKAFDQDVRSVKTITPTQYTVHTSTMKLNDTDFIVHV